MNQKQKTSLPLNALKNHKESDVFVPCPIVWNGECGCVTPSCFELHTACMYESLENAPVMLLTGT